MCDVGHVVCSPCRKKLKTTGKCHICGVTTGYYHRCHAMERLVESIRVPCPHASYGCTDKLAYFDQHSHWQACAHAPCHCPDEACSFIGSMAPFMGHITGIHGWPLRTEVRAGDDFHLVLRDGFNFVLANRSTDDGQGASAGSSQYLLLLNVVRQQPLGRAISVVCIHSHGASGGNGGQQGPSSCEIQCRLTYSHYYYKARGDQLMTYYQLANCKFGVPQMDVSDRLPSPDNGCFQFVVLDSGLADGDKDAMEVTARIDII
ncbi:hypothetical protein ACP4OV_006701 [Aristida adscensionis]